MSVLDEFLEGDFVDCADFPPFSVSSEKMEDKARRHRADQLGTLIWKMAGRTNARCAELLHAYLSRNKDVRAELTKLETETELTKVQKQLGVAFNAARSDREKRNFLQFACDIGGNLHGSFKKLKALGYKVGKKLLRSVRDETHNGESCHPLPTRKRGTVGALLPEAKRQKLRELFESPEVSQLTANRVGDVNNPPRVLVKTRTAVGNVAKQSKIACRNTVFKYLEAGGITTPCALTDMCPYCDRYRELLLYEPRLCAKICARNALFGPRTIQDIGEAVDIYNPGALLASDVDAIAKFVDEVGRLEFHREVRDVQFGAYRAHTAPWDSGSNSYESVDYAVVHADFSSIAVNRGPIQLDHQVRESPSVSVLVFIVHLPGIRSPIAISVLSDCMSRASEAASVGCERAIAAMRTSSDKKIKKAWAHAAGVKLWFDCGTHFRSLTFLQYCLVELVKLERRAVVEYSLFEVKHGKGACDRMISILKGYVKEYTTHHTVKGLDDLQSCLAAKHAQTNENRQQQQQPPSTLLITKYSAQDVGSRSLLSLKLKHLHSSYCFRSYRSGANVSIENAVLTSNATAIPLGLSRDITLPAAVGEKATPVDRGAVVSKRIPVGLLKAREGTIRRALAHTGSTTVQFKTAPSEVISSGACHYITRHAVKVGSDRRKARKLAKEACRYIYLDMTNEEGSFVVGMLLGELSEEEVREHFGGGTSAVYVFAELYTAGPPLSAVFAVEELVAWSTGKGATLMFLEDTVGKHLSSRDGEVRDFWVKCTACGRWRTVAHSVYDAAEGRSVWKCPPPGCDAPASLVESQL